MAVLANLQLGSKVRDAREHLGLTRESVADAAGVSAITIIRLENYGQVPRAATLAAIAQHLGLSLDELLGVERAAS